MNTERDADTILGAWLDDGPLRLPDDTRRAIAVGLRTTPQRRGRFGWLAGQGRGFMLPNGLRIAVAMGLLALVVTAGIVVVDGRLPGLVPAASPSPWPTASPFAGPAPPGTPSPGAIAYLRGERIMLVDPGTGDQRALTPQLRDVVAEHVGSDCVGEAPELPAAAVGPSSMAWSPDGRALAFVVVHSCGHTVFGISADGTTMRVLFNAERLETRSTRGGRSYPYGLHWSPDGSRITVSGASAVTANGQQTIVVVSLDASEPIELGSICEKCSLYPEVSGAWSPDGTMVAAIFHHQEETDQLVAVVDVMAGRWTTLWSWQSGEWIFVPDVNPWLPDGSLIIEAVGELFAVHPDNPQQRTALEVETPDRRTLIGWNFMSPDGSRMVSSDLDGQLVVSDIRTGETAQLADLKGGTYAWSPDSSEIAVVASDSIPGPSSVWVVSADGSNAREVLETGSESQLVWQPVWP